MGSHTVKTPCKKCILKCICKHKQFIDLVDDCSLLRSFILSKKRNIKVGNTMFYGTNHKKVKKAYKDLQKPLSSHDKDHPFFFTD